MLVSVLELLYALCCGCNKLSCLSNVHSSAQTLLLAHSFELHPATTLSPVLQPRQPGHHIHSFQRHWIQHAQLFCGNFSMCSIQSVCSLCKAKQTCWCYCSSTQSVSSCQQTLCFTTHAPKCDTGVQL